MGGLPGGELEPDADGDRDVAGAVVGGRVDARLRGAVLGVEDVDVACLGKQPLVGEAENLWVMPTPAFTPAVLLE